MSTIGEATLTDCTNALAYAYGISRAEAGSFLTETGLSDMIRADWRFFWPYSETSVDIIRGVLKRKGIELGEPVNDPEDYCISDDYTPVIVFWREYPDGNYPDTVQFVIPKGFNADSYV